MHSEIMKFAHSSILLIETTNRLAAVQILSSGNAKLYSYK